MAQESTRPYPVDELLTAVRLEVAAELRSDGKDNQKVPLSQGRRTSSTEGRHKYLFQCRKWQDGLDGKPVLVRPSRSTGAWAQAEAKRLPDGNVRLTTAVDLGNAPAHVQIREDDAAGWRTLAERLEAVGQPDHPVRVESAGWMVGRGNPRLGNERSMDRWVANWVSLQLNSGQRQAVSQALAGEVTFLWGPPGTGKTDVVGHIIEGSYRQDLTVLFLAPTKVAVDQALERVCHLLSAETGFPDGLVQRAGDITVPSLRDRYGEQVDPDLIAARLSAALDAALTERADELRIAQTGIAVHDKVGALRADLATAQQQHTQATQSRDAANSAQAGARREIAEQTALIEKIGFPRGLFADRKQKQLDDARAVVTSARTRLESITSNLAAAERARRHAMAEVTRLRSALQTEEAKMAGLPGRASLASRADRLQTALSRGLLRGQGRGEETPGRPVGSQAPQMVRGSVQGQPRAGCTVAAGVTVIPVTAETTRRLRGMLGLPVGPRPEAFQSFAEDYRERSVGLDAVRHIYERRSLTRDVVARLNPDASFADVVKDAQGMGCPDRWCQRFPAVRGGRASATSVWSTVWQPRSTR
ncbi:AAA domain-containing protein [Streptomyces hirsutus]|uniref:AAA domain-containing protein n=1 Tax=Streptomyces hirsutus TaxID=35620 RepID=UPI003F4E3870